MGFALKVKSWRRFGFAAGCEAVASPRRSDHRRSWAVPLVRAQPLGFIWPQAAPRAQPKV